MDAESAAVILARVIHGAKRPRLCGNPMDYNAAHDRYPQRAFGCLCGHHSDDEKVSLSDAFQTSLRALFQDLRGAHAPTRRIAFIVFLKPRILSTRVRL